MSLYYTDFPVIQAAELVQPDPFIDPINITSKPLQDPLPFLDRIYYQWVQPILPEGLKRTSYATGVNEPVLTPNERARAGLFATTPAGSAAPVFLAAAAAAAGIYFLAKAAK